MQYLAMGVLKMAFIMITVMSLIIRASTNEYHDVIEWKLMKLLVAKCQQKDILTSAEFKATFNEASMKGNDNPEVFADALAQIMALYWLAKIKINNDKFNAMALAAALKEYTRALGMEQTKAEFKGEIFTVDNVVEAMVKPGD